MPYHVAIVGAGPAGSAVAIRLARAGYRVLLLERARFPRDKICGDYIGPRGLRELVELGVMPELCQREQPIPLSSATIFVDGVLSDSRQLPRLDGYEGFGVAIARSVLDRALFDRARQLGADTREGCFVRAYRIASDGVHIDADVEGRATTFRAAFLVGADGAQSCIARRAGLEIGDADHTMVTMRAYVHGVDVESSNFHFFRDFFPGFGWVFPLRPGLGNIGVGMLKSALVNERVSLRAFYARLAELARTWAPRGKQPRYGAPRGWVIKTYGARRTHTFERGLLVGEAAGLVDPISGEGISHALESARYAADTLHDAFATGASLLSYDVRCAARWDIDLSLADWVVTLVKNRQLSDVWMASMALLGRMTSQDPYLAATLGGVLAGTVPMRQAFSPTTWLHASLSSAQVLGSSASRVRDGLLLYDAVLQNVLAEPERFRTWALDVREKQTALARRWWEMRSWK